MNWALSIQDSDTRDSQLQDLGQQWMDANPTQATQWLNSANVPDRVKHQILQNYQNNNTAAGAPQVPEVTESTPPTS
jgi:hypothetical protein